MTLQEFLIGNTIEETSKEVILGERFKDEKGNHFKFKIKALDSNQWKQARKKAVNISRKGDMSFDTVAFHTDIIINNTIEPNFKSADSIKAVGVSTPEQFLQKVLLPGEIELLGAEIEDLSGFNTKIVDLIEDVKN